MDPQTEFRFAPSSWTPAKARDAAAADGLTLVDDHWALIHALQEFHARHATGEIRLRDLQDALEEKFHHRGGMKYLYQLCPGGPVVQGCRLAGLTPPAGAIDRGFGSVT